MLKRKVRAAIESSGMFRRSVLVLVGVSGGPDSVSLMHLLASLSQDFGYSLHVAHLNHRLRGAESDLDAQFVGELAERLGLPATIEARDVAAVRRCRKLGMEEAARVVRYQFFAELASRLGAAGVAVGHTADDQVETVVQHWLRGAGLAGLRGMALVTDQQVGQAWRNGGTGQIRVVRPMLAVTRREVESYIRLHHLPSRVDVSNLDRCYQRNRVRSELLPYLEQYNPSIRPAVLRMARLAEQDFDFIQSQVRAAWATIATVQRESVVIDLDGWLRLPASLQYYTLRHGASVLLGDAMDISAANIADAAEALRHKPVGTTIVWPRQLRVVKGYRDFAMHVGEPVLGPAIIGRQRLNVPGRTKIAGTDWEIVANVANERCAGPHHDSWHADLDFDETGPELYVRKRQAGDSFVPLGMTGDKKLQDFLVDQKVPRSQRDAVPLVVSPNQVVWVAGLRLDERVKVSEQTTRVICLTFEKTT